MPEFWYSKGGFSVMLVYAWLAEDMALGLRINERREKATPTAFSRAFLKEWYVQSDVEPWFFPDRSNEWCKEQQVDC